MVKASCHCGAVRLQIAAAPTEITDCNCSICRRYGVLWAYYPPDAVSIATSGKGTQTYMWDDRSLAFHRCPDCGCVTHWAPVDPAVGRMGVNARLMDPRWRGRVYAIWMAQEQRPISTRYGLRGPVRGTGLVKGLRQRRMHMDRAGDVFQHRAHFQRMAELA